MSAKCYLEVREVECSGVPQLGSLPETVEELEATCEIIKSRGRCILKSYERCAQDENYSDNEEDARSFRNNLMFSEAACDEDSSIYKALSSDIKCASATTRLISETCNWDKVNKMDREKIINLIEDSPEICTINAWVMSCINAKFYVECGSEIRGAVNTILLRLDYVTDDEHCFRDVLPKLSYLEEAFKSAFRVKTRDEIIQEVIGVIQKETS